MKYYITGLLMAFLVVAEPNTANAQFFGKRTPELSGQHAVNNLEKNAGHSWFANGMHAYDTEPETIAALKKSWSPDLRIVAFGGSWCPDTHREMPGFFRTLQDAGVPDEKVELYFLNRRMRSETGVEKKYQITSVPTFVVLRNGTEIGRINAGSKVPAEQALLRIVQQ